MNYSAIIDLMVVLLPGLPVLSAIFMFFSKDLVVIRNTAILSSITVFATALFFLYKKTIYADLISIVSTPFLSNNDGLINFYFSMDGVSLLFVTLTAFLMPICFLSIQGTVDREREYTIALLLLHTFINCIFMIPNLLMFYIFFESVLIPMYFIIGVMGSRLRRVYASYLLVLYTLFGSVPMLFALLYLYYLFGTFDYYSLWDAILQDSSYLSENTKNFLWLAFFMGFAVKVPMVPFHIWLPEAHVEAPTAGSVILAGILLKIGTYGFLRYSIPLFFTSSIYFSPFIYILSSVAIIYTSLTTLRQIDLKKIVAYSSVAHMGYVTMGLFSMSQIGIEGSVLIMISHGFVSSALFLCIGIVYDRYKTRVYKYYSGIAQFMPLFIVFFLIFTMANLGLPGTSSFPGEFMTILGMFEVNFFASAIAVFGTILSAGYALWMFNRVSFGTLKTNYLSVISDVDARELFFLLPLCFCTVFFGLFPEFILTFIHWDISSLLGQTYNLFFENFSSNSDPSYTVYSTKEAVTSYFFNNKYISGMRWVSMAIDPFSHWMDAQLTNTPVFLEAGKTYSGDWSKCRVVQYNEYINNIMELENPKPCLRKVFCKC